MALAHKGLPWEAIPWRFCDKGQNTNPTQVPVLIDGGERLIDSWNIAVHLEDRFPDRPSLFGSRSAIAITRFVNSWADSILIPAIARVILLDIYQCISAADRDYFRTSREAYFGTSLEQVVADQPQRLADLRTALQPLRRMLKNQRFIGGSTPTYADYCVFGMFMWTRCASRVSIIEPEDTVAPWYEGLLDAFGGLARNAPSI